VKSISILSGKNKQKNTQNKPEPKTGKLQFQYSYSIMPTNFVNLSEESQAQKLGQFFDILRIIEDRIKITMSRRMVAITVEGQILEMPVMQVHLESHQPLGDMLDQIKVEYISGDRPPRHKIIKENLSMMKIQTIHLTGDASVTGKTTDEQLSLLSALEESSHVVYAKCFALHGLPASLPYAWITQIFQICSQIQIWINPVSKDESITRMLRFKNIIYDDSKKDRSTAELYKRADDTENSLRREETGLYECIINCTITAQDKKKLHEMTKSFKKQVKRHGGSFGSVSAKQAAMIQEGYGKKLTLDRGSCAILYSFASSDMLEIPNGIPLGINMISRGPVIFDIAKRINYNIAVIGKSGSGKSFTVKILLNRLHQKFPDSNIYVIDPMGEYGAISSFLGMDNLNITKSGEKLGLDPFILLDPQDAADILAEMTNAPDTTKIQFQKYCDKAKNMDEFYKKLPKTHRKYLDHLMDGPLSRIILGEPKLNDSDKIIISMDGATGNDSEAMILVLLLNKIFKICSKLPTRTRKILVIDEAWMLFKMPGAAKYVNMVVRMGRKLNINFIFISQRIEDISKEDESGIGKIIDNMETKIILGLEEQAAETARKVLNLSDQETSKLKSFNRGHALFLTRNHRIHAKFEPTTQEKEMFDTTPLE